MLEENTTNAEEHPDALLEEIDKLKKIVSEQDIELIELKSRIEAIESQPIHP